MTSAAALHDDLLALIQTDAPPWERKDALEAWVRQACLEGEPPDRLRRDSASLDERLDAHVIDGLDGCLIWDGPVEARASGNCPVVRWRGTMQNVRLLVWKRAGRERSASQRIVPACGNALCVRVEHLEVESTRIPADVGLRRLQVEAMRLGYTPAAKDWSRLGLRPAYKWFHRTFGSWDNAVRLAGLAPPVRAQGNQWNRQEDWPKACKRGIRALARHLNRPPSGFDVAQHKDWLLERGLPSSATTYKKHLGGDPQHWRNVLDAAGVA